MNRILPQDLGIWVHTWWKRDKVRDPYLASLDRSDAAGRYTVERQSVDDLPVDFFLGVMRRWCVQKPWFLRVEDDVIVNKHLVHNVCTWPVPHDEPDFGCGYLTVPQRVVDDIPHSGRGKATGCPFRNYPRMHFGGLVLFRSDRILPLLDEVRKDMTGSAYRGSPNVPFACSPSFALWSAGFRSYFHLPSLGRIDFGVPRSYDGKLIPEQVHGPQPFDAEWRR